MAKDEPLWSLPGSGSNGICRSLEAEQQKDGQEGMRPLPGSKTAETLFCSTFGTRRSIHSSFYLMDVCTHVAVTSRLSHPCIKQPREPRLLHLFATEDGSIHKLFFIDPQRC